MSRDPPCAACPAPPGPPARLGVLHLEPAGKPHARKPGITGLPADRQQVSDHLSSPFITIRIGQSLTSPTVGRHLYSDTSNEKTGQHWRFTVREAVDGPGPPSALVLGSLEGVPVLPADPCDIRYPGRPAIRLSAAVTAADPAPDADGQTYLVITGLEPEYLRPGATLWSPCSVRPGG
jgi:hypothetical protein